MRQNNCEQTIIALAKYIECNIGNGKLITVSQISKSIYVSISQLEKCSIVINKKSPKAIINEAIVKKAVNLYVNSKLSVKEISDLLGFKEESSFCHFFKNNTGQRISNFKKYTDLNNFYTDLNNSNDKILP